MAPRNDDPAAAIGSATNEVKSFAKNLLVDVKKGSTYKQMGFGAAAGWLAGYLGLKVGKIAATSVGCGLLLTQIASHKGYINWKRLNEDMRRVQSEVKGAAPSLLSDVRSFVSENKYIATGFAGGFLIGMSLS